MVVTSKQDKAARELVGLFSTEWKTIEQVARADEYRDSRPPVFVLGWQTDLELVASFLMRVGLLHRKDEGGIVRFRRVAGRTPPAHAPGDAAERPE